MNSKQYWEKYYSQHPHPFNPSAFAIAISRHIKKPGLLIELGCGNGRDAIFFSQKLDVNVLAIDQCELEIERLARDHSNDKLEFVAADFSRYEPQKRPLYVYSRWTIHAIDELAEERTFGWVGRQLKSGGKLFIEARSIRDDLYGVGEKVGNHAFISDHYRRFIEMGVFQSRLEKVGFKIDEAIESRGLAALKDDDPFLVRVVAVKI
jgi:SAM-dependent methyltransferase